MINEPFLTSRLADFLSWRNGLNRSIGQVKSILTKHDLLDERNVQTLQHLLARIEQDRLTIAFVSEAERGKSELINALFFAERKRRLLPSGPGRTTLCVTELRYDPGQESGVRLLPIETRESSAAYAELMADTDAWRFVPFVYEDFDSIQRALGSLSETRRVTLAEAVSWGLHADAASRPAMGGAALVDVPRWRHAIINMPHPVLQAGLVVYDTPGLSALAAEPDLSRKRLPQFDCVVFILDAEHGMTRQDLSIWREYLGGRPVSPTQGRMTEPAPPNRLVAVNKIDALYESTPNNADVLKRLDKIVKDAADVLRIDPIKVIPLSARMGFIAKTSEDKDKLLKSRLYQIERAITRELTHDRQNLVAEETEQVLTEMVDAARAGLDHERFEMLESLRHMAELRERNSKLIGNLVGQASSHLERYENALKEVRALRSRHGRLAEELAGLADREVAKSQAEETAHSLSGAMMPGAVEERISAYIAGAREQVKKLEAKVAEIKSLYEEASARMSRELGMPPMELLPFSTQRFHAEIQKAETQVEAEIKGATLMLKRGSALAQHFQEICGSRIFHLFEIASRESSLWMRGMLSALDKSFERLKDASLQRAQGTEKLRMADFDLAEKISEVQARLDVIKAKHQALADLEADLHPKPLEDQADTV